MADSALNSTASRFLLYFTGTRATDVLHERRAQNAGDPVLGDDAARLMRGNAEQRQIKQAESTRQSITLNCRSRQYRRGRNKERQQSGVLTQQLLIAFVFFFRFLAVFLDREICLVPAIVRFWRAHTIESQTSTRLRVRGLGPSGRARAKYFRCELGG